MKVGCCIFLGMDVIFSPSIWLCVKLINAKESSKTRGKKTKQPKWFVHVAFYFFP
jgi:hypothetical protein